MTEAVLYFHRHWPPNLIDIPVMAAGRSMFYHVAIGYDGVVLDTRRNGARFWVETTYVGAMKDLHSVVHVPVNGPIHLDRTIQRPVEVWRSIANWAVGPMFQAHNCVSHARQTLERKVERGIWWVETPGGLWRWTQRHGLRTESADEARSRCLRERGQCP